MLPRRSVLRWFPTVLFLLGAAMATAEECDLKLWVVEAGNENRDTPHFDAGLDEIKSVLKSLPHDTYRKVSAKAHHLKSGAPTKVPLVENFTLEATAPERRGDGRYQTDLRILTQSKDKPPKEIEALSTELLLQPEKQVVVRGLKKKTGKELLLVLCLSVKKTD